MRFSKLAVAAAALSMAGAAIAAGTTTTTPAPSSSDQSYSTKDQAGTTSSDKASSTNATPAGAASANEKDSTMVRSAQEALKQNGFDAGPSDGRWGPSTENAVKNFQQAQGLPQSGELDQKTLDALDVQKDQGSMNGKSSTGDKGSMSDKGRSMNIQGSSTSRSGASYK